MKTVFIRAIEVPPEAKSAAISSALRGDSSARIDIDLSDFRSIPQSPFAYWLPDSVRSVFHKFRPFDDESAGRTARCGLGTLDDFRFLRLGWEAPVGPARWKTYYNGGTYSPFYEQTTLVVNWQAGGSEIKSFVEQKVGSASRKVQGSEYYFQEGFYFPRRTKALCPKVMPSGGIFSTGGQAGFAARAELFATIALMSSRLSSFLVAVTQGRTGDAAQFEVGLIKRLPWPLQSATARDLDALGRRSWAAMRRLDTRTESSCAFLVPGLLQVQADDLSGRAAEWAHVTSVVLAELAALAAEIDDQAYRLYEISVEDRDRIEKGFGGNHEPEETDDANDDANDDELEAAEVDATPMVASLLSWALGVAFGRFDVRLATGERKAPPEPEPFAPLPLCSPGMLTGDDDLPVAEAPAGYPVSFPTDGILVDDPGHPQDMVRAVRAVFEPVFDDANARWHEAAELLGTPDLRTWFARDFFEPHIKRYSKSRRKAPIYWQLATASGSYSVWIYIHRATGDTLFRVLNDFVRPKLAHEKAKLDGLTQEAGANPSASQRREIEQQANFVGELQAFKTEVARVAPLWKPNLDDGVILNFAPLWRLVPQSRSWQGECKKAWDKLVAHDYDWAHLAMDLWPERVVPKCMDDRSLAIAHGLEDVFWHKDDSGTWRKSRVDDATVQKLIHERTSTTVKAALKELVSAATPTMSKGRKAKVRNASSRNAAPKAAPAAARATGSDTAVDEATLRAVSAAIANVAEGASKADVLLATGLSDGDWNKAIAALLDRGDVTRAGQKRGTRYHSNEGGKV